MGHSVCTEAPSLLAVLTLSVFLVWWPALGLSVVLSEEGGYVLTKLR